MLYVKQTILIICIIFYFLSHGKGSGDLFATASGSTQKEAKKAIHAEILSGTVQNGGKESTGNTGVSQFPRCDQECKVKAIIDVGIREEIASSLVTHCKALADDPRKCILMGASIVKNESGGGYKCRNVYNCFGIMGQSEYKSYSDATLHFAGKFQKWWRNADDMSFFYPLRGQVSRSRYCTSEHSSNSSIGCPNGLKNSTFIFNKLSNIF